MAIVQLKDVKVTNVFSKGFRVVEESKGRDGATYSTRFTVWSDGLGVREGDVVSLSGFLGAKVGEWTDRDQQVRYSVELSINSPRLSGDRQEAAAAPDPAAPAADVWSTSGNYTDETPF